MKTEIPQWVVEYNNVGHGSGAARAIKILMDRRKEDEDEIKELKEALRLFENATTVKLFNEAKDKAKKLLE